MTDPETRARVISKLLPFIGACYLVTPIALGLVTRASLWWAGYLIGLAVATVSSLVAYWLELYLDGIEDRAEDLRESARLKKLKNRIEWRKKQ